MPPDFSHIRNSPLFSVLEGEDCIDTTISTNDKERSCDCWQVELAQVSETERASHSHSSLPRLPVAVVAMVEAYERTWSTYIYVIDSA